MKLKFEWDSEKAENNLKKHGISFETATYVFDDDYRLDIYDEWHSVNEDRYVTIGMANKILYVVYTLRTETIRIVSARLATLEERRLYYDNLL